MDQTNSESVLRLSDDEVVALSLGAGQLIAVLPTVDISDEASLLRAAARGWRSLAIRGLVVGSQTTYAVQLGDIEGALGTLPVIRAYVAQAGIEEAVDGATTSFIVAETGRVLVDVTTPTGIHAFDFCTPEAALVGITAASIDVAEAGVVANRPDLALCVAYFNPDGGREVIRVSPDGVRRIIVESDGSQTDRGVVSLDLWLRNIGGRALGVIAAAGV